MAQKSARRLSFLLVVAVIGYFFVVGYRGFSLLGRPEWDLKLLGLVVFAFPLIGAWIVVVELRFGFTTQLLAEELNAEGAPPEPEMPRLPSGRVDRKAADSYFHERRAIVEADPEDWHGWYYLAVSYDLAGDRRRGREAMRTAARLRYSNDAK